MKNRLLFLGVFALAVASFVAAGLVVAWPRSSQRSTTDSWRWTDPPAIPPSQLRTCWPPLYGADEVKPATPLSTERGTAPVYKVDVPLVNEQFAAGIAAKFGMEGSPEMATPGPSGLPFARSSFILKTETATLDVFLDGWFVYYTEPYGATPSVVEPLIPKEQAEQQVTDFLRIRGLLPEEAQLGTVEVGWQGGWDVSFYDRRLGDCAMLSDISVATDPSGKIVHLSWRFMSLVTVHEYPIVSEEEAYQRILNGLACPWFFEPPVELEAPELCYFDTCERSQNQSQCSGPLHFVPTYEFRVTAANVAAGNGRMDVPALTDEYMLPPGITWPPSNP